MPRIDQQSFVCRWFLVTEEGVPGGSKACLSPGIFFGTLLYDLPDCRDKQFHQVFRGIVVQGNRQLNLDSSHGVMVFSA